MDLWKHEALKVVNLVLGASADLYEQWILIGVGILAMIVVMRLVGSAAGISDIGWGRRVVALVFGLGALLAAEVAANLYILPALTSADLRHVAAVGAPILGALLVGIPLQMLALKARYGQALMVFALALIAAVLLGMGAKAALASVRAGDAETRSLLRRQEDTRKLLRDTK